MKRLEDKGKEKRYGVTATYMQLKLDKTEINNMFNPPFIFDDTAAFD